MQTYVYIRIHTSKLYIYALRIMTQFQKSDLQQRFAYVVVKVWYVLINLKLQWELLGKYKREDPRRIAHARARNQAAKKRVQQQQRCMTPFSSQARMTSHVYMYIYVKRKLAWKTGPIARNAASKGAIPRFIIESYTYVRVYIHIYNVYVYRTIPRARDTPNCEIY